MFDTLAVAQQFAAGGVARDQAEVIARAIHDGLGDPAAWMTTSESPGRGGDPGTEQDRRLPRGRVDFPVAPARASTDE